MKKILISILFASLISMSFGQNYYPLLQENRTWNVISVELVGPDFWDTTYSTSTYQFFGDTTINAHSYQSLYESSEEVPLNWNLWCFMREDSSKRVWGRRESSTEEMLMYDFSAEVGDSVLVGLVAPVYLYVDSISEININQTNRKKYWLSCKTMPEYSETWIEGVGSNKGICWSGSANLVGGWNRFLCMSDTGELIYSNPNYESCYLVTDITENNKPIINIYPNPAKGTLIIQNKENVKIKSISILDLNERILKQFDINQTRLNISGISSGIYLLKISYKNGELLEKVIIE